MKKRFSKFLALALAMIMIVTAMPVTGAARGDSNASKYPSQTISAETGDGITVTVKAPKGALPAKTTMNVARVRDISSVQSAVNAAGYDGDVRLAVDITFMNNGKEIQPEKSVKVAVESYELSGVRDLSVVHLDADAEGVRSGVAVEQIGGAKLKGSSVSFSARHFSIYAIIGDSSEPAMTVNFFGENLSEPIYSIRVTQAMIGHLDDYIVVDPEVVTSSSIGHDKVFCGWTMRSNYTVENITGAAARDYNIENVRAAVNRVLNNNFVDGNTISVYAMLFYEYSVRFFGEPKNVNGSNVVPVYEVKTVYSRERASASNKLSVKVDLDYPVADRDSNFSGWKITGDSSNTLYKLNDTIQITGDTELTPEVASGHWLTFIENPDGNHKGATYTAPRFYANGERTVRPTDPTLKGYHLEGWYENYNENTGVYSNKYNFNQTLSASKTLYAKWVIDDYIDYTVIVWKQNVDDDRYAVDADKTYDYAFSVQLSAPHDTTIANLPISYYEELHTHTYTVAGETVTSEHYMNEVINATDSADKWHSFLGFELNTTRGRVSTDATIRPAGTTVVNIYWNRALCTIDFVSDIYTSATPSWSSSNTYYFKIGDNYYQCYRSSNTTYIYEPVNSISANYTYYLLYQGSWVDLYYGNGYWRSSSANVYFTDSTIQSYLNSESIAARRTIQSSGSYYYISVDASILDTSLSEHYYIVYNNTICLVDYAPTSSGSTYYWWVYYNGDWSRLSTSSSYDITSDYTLYERYSNSESGYYTVTTGITQSFEGLYGQRLSKYGYTYPRTPRYFIASDSNTFVSILDMFSDSSNDNPDSLYHTVLYGRDVSYNASVYHFLQDVNGNYSNTVPTYTIGTKKGNGMVFRSFQGFTRYRFRIKLPSGVTTYQTGTSYSGDSLVNPVSHSAINGYTDWYSYGTGIEYTGNENHETVRWDAPVAEEGAIEFRYSRNKYNIHYLYGKFVDGDGNAIDAPAGAAGEMHTSADIYYEADIRSYQSSGTGGNYYDPVAAGDFDNAAYIFEGWFADKDCTVPYYFDNPAAGTTGNYKVQKNMPLDGVTVYTKFRQVQYRVFLHPNGGDLPQGQADTFRRPYDSVISEGQQINATRDGWVLAGWYTDPDFEHRFNFETHLVESTVTTDYNQTEITDYENGVGYNSDAENNRYWITKKLDLYAKWIKPLDGVNGIIVRYDADQVGSSADPIDGSRDGVRYYYDPAVYSDGADAIARTASTPVDDDMLFAYWVLVDENGDPILDGEGNEIHYLPGDHFDIDAQNSYAQPSDEPNPSVQAPARTSSSTSNSVSANGASSSKTASASKAASASKSSASKTNDRGPIVPTATNTLLTENFDSMSSISTTYSGTGWYAYKSGNGNNWTLNTSSSYANSGSKSAQVEYSSRYAANCYLVSAPFTLSADATALNLSLYESVRSSTYAETFEAFFVKASDVTSAAGVASATKYQAIASASYTNTSYAEKTGSVQNVSALTGQSVRLVIHCTSAANMYYLYIDDITVTQTLPDVPCTVTYMANGSEYASATAYIGTTTTLPFNATEVSGYEFIGWTTGTVSETTNMPTCYTPGTQSPTITGDTTFYALYSRSEGEIVYQRVYEIQNGVKYVIVANNSVSTTTGYAVGNAMPSGETCYLDAVEVTINDTDNTVTATTANLPRVIWTASGNNTAGYSFYNTAAGKYMGLDSGYFIYPGDTAVTWKFTSDEWLDNGVDPDLYYFLSYSTSNNWYTTSKTSTTTDLKIRLYAETGSGTTYYTTNATATHTVTFVDSDGTTTLGTATVTDGGNVNSSDIPTPTAPNGYAFDGWTIQGGNGSVLTSAQVAALTISDDMTFVAHYTATSSCTVTYKVDGNVEGTETVNPGSKVTLPSTVENEPSGYTFIGWVQATVASTTTQPTYYQPGAQSPAITGNTTFYALFTHTEQGGGGVVYNRVYQLQNDGRYIIVANSSVTGTTGYAVGNTIISGYGHYLTPVSVTINDTDNTVTATETNLPKVVWVASGNDTDGYTFYNEAVGKYIAYSSDYLIVGDIGLTWVLTANKWLDNRVDSEGYYYLSYATATTSNPIDRYTTGKYESGTTTSDYVIRLYSETELDTTYYSTGIQRYTVTFYDHSGLISTQTVAAGAAAEAPADPASYTDNGKTYDFAGWDTDFSNVTSNLEVHAQYLEHGESTIDFNTNVVYLKAHYVARARIDVKLDANGLTFVDTATQDAILSALDGWNTEDISRTGSRIDQDRLHINDSVVLPGTALFTPSGTVGYRITGWNTMPDGTGTEFHFGDTVYVDNLSRTNNSSENVLYAMWESYAYVYHSGVDGETVETYKVGDIDNVMISSTRAADAQNVVGTLNLVEMTTAKDRTLRYAGYSTTYYGGITSNYGSLRFVDNWDAEIVSGRKYNPDRAYVQGVTKWWKYNEMSAVDGRSIKPSVGIVYYIKQVPEAYLNSRIQYIYNMKEGNKISKIYLITVVDDQNYSQVGFNVEDGFGNKIATLAGSFVFEQEGTGTQITTKPNSFKDIERGFIGWADGQFEGNDGYIPAGLEFTMTPYWITKDGVTVDGNGRTFVCDDGTMDTIHEYK